MDAYLEEELYDLLTYCAQKPDASDFDLKKQRVTRNRERTVCRWRN